MNEKNEKMMKDIQKCISESNVNTNEYISKKDAIESYKDFRNKHEKLFERLAK